MNYIPLELYRKNQDKFNKYLELLIKWNKKINLTSVSKVELIEDLHFIDSLAVLPDLVSRGTYLKLLDIGSGAGFPGIPIKIVLPDIQVTLVESIKKKCDFMKEVIRSIKLNGIDVLNTRLGPGVTIGSFDLIVSRATMKFDLLLEIAVKNLASTGVVVAYKGLDVSEEIERAKAVCGGKFWSIREVVYQLPFSGKKRKLLLAEAH